MPDLRAVHERGRAELTPGPDPVATVAAEQTQSVDEPLTLAEASVLALLAEGPAHGWAIVGELSATGAIGRIWSLSRALTYRTIDLLVGRGLVARAGKEPGRGQVRQLLDVSAAGRRALAVWLDQPVDHLRDVRTELLVKLTLRRRAGLDLVSLVEDQQLRFEPLYDRFDPASDDLVERWRAESSAAVRHFLAATLAAERTGPAASPAE